MTITLRLGADGRRAPDTPLPIPRRPALDPWAMAALNVLTEHYAQRYGDTAEITKARRDALDTALAARRAP